MLVLYLTTLLPCSLSASVVKCYGETLADSDETLTDNHKCLVKGPPQKETPPLAATSLTSDGNDKFESELCRQRGLLSIEEGVRGSSFFFAEMGMGAVLLHRSHFRFFFSRMAV